MLDCSAHSAKPHYWRTITILCIINREGRFMKDFQSSRKAEKESHMQRLLIATLLILATCSLAVSQDKQKNSNRQSASSTRSMKGVTIRGNVVRFNSTWEIVKGSNGNTYARKKKVKAVIVLAVSCKCAQEGPQGTCFLQSMPGRNDALQCNKAPNCTGSCGVVTSWVETKDIETIGLP